MMVEMETGLVTGVWTNGVWTARFVCLLKLRTQSVFQINASCPVSVFVGIYYVFIHSTTWSGQLFAISTPYVTTMASSASKYQLLLISINDVDHDLQQSESFRGRISVVKRNSTPPERPEQPLQNSTKKVVPLTPIFLVSPQDIYI